MNVNTVFGRIGYKILDDKRIIIFSYDRNLEKVEDMIVVNTEFFSVMVDGDSVHVWVGEQKFNFESGGKKHSKDFTHSLTTDIIQDFSLKGSSHQSVKD